MAWIPYKLATHAMVISVASDWREQLPGVDSLELSRRIWEVIRSGRKTAARYFILDDDVDPTDLAELGWALATRVHPTKRHLVTEEPILPLLACYTPEERFPKGGGTPTGPKVTYDALLLPEGEGRERRASFQFLYPENIKQRVIDHWNGALPAGRRQRGHPLSPISSVPAEVSRHGR
jgi:4-hydroxy-3-polyprenylbenzoate decarboxylase